MSTSVRLERGLVELGVADVSELSMSDLIEKLLAFTDDLIKWNKVYNLTAIRQPDEIVTSHLLDSLSIYNQVGTGSVIDVGTGGGFPGIPLAILFPRLDVSLLDSNVKKTRFLQQVVINHQLSNCNVIHSRAESFEGSYDQVVCRAFASLPKIVDFAGHMVAPGGRLLAMKGRLEDEMSLLGGCETDFRVIEVVELVVPGLEAERHLVVMQRKGAQ